MLSNSLLKWNIVCISKYSETLVCEHNSLWKHARNPKHLHIKANFPIIMETQMIHSTTQEYSYKNGYNTVIQYKIIKKIQNIKKNTFNLNLPLKTYVASVREVIMEDDYHDH